MVYLVAVVLFIEAGHQNIQKLYVSYFRTRPPSPYQGRSSEVSKLHESTAMCLRTRVGNHARTRLRAQLKKIDTKTHDTDKSTTIHQQHAQTCSPWYLWIVFLVLIVDVLPISCNGARANVHQECTPHFGIT